MPSTIKRRRVDDALTLFLNETLQFEVGFVDPPSIARQVDADQSKKLRYAIVQPLEGGDLYGPPLTAPEADAELPYQITCVGVDHRSATWVADEVRTVMCGRDSHGVFVHDLTLEEHTVMDREQVPPIGVPRLEAGVYQVVDSYNVKVSRDDR